MDVEGSAAETTHRPADADITLDDGVSQALIDAAAVAEESLAEAIAEQAAPAEPAAAVDEMDMDYASHEAGSAS